MFRDPFVAAEDEDEIYNLLTMEVMTEKVSKDILDWNEIGQRILVEFATEHLTEGWLCAWDKMTKTKLKTFRTSNAKIAMNAGGKLVNIKEERGLLEFGKIDRHLKKLITAWSEGLSECIGTYSSMNLMYTVVPRSLFASDGTVLLVYDKAKILHHLELLVSNEQLAMHTAKETSTSIAPDNDNGQETYVTEIAHAPDLTRNCLIGINDTSQKYNVIIIDGMAIINAIPNTEIIKTYNDFEQDFLDQLSNMVGDCNDVKLVSTPLSKNKLEENGQINILACHGNYLNP